MNVSSTIPVADGLVAAIIAARLRTVTRDVACLTTVVALATIVIATGALVRAVTGNVTSVTALVARLVARLGAVTLYVARLATVVARTCSDGNIMHYFNAVLPTVSHVQNSSRYESKPTFMTIKANQMSFG